MPPSISEEQGLSLLTDADLRVYSVGISTGGVAEIRMAKHHPDRQIIATTIDPEGARFAQQYIAAQGQSSQITIRLEDVSQPLPYANGAFDFIYARLVLHYLPKTQLQQALGELYRILKPTGRLFVVVRSTQCQEAQAPNSSYNPATGLTIYTSCEGVSYTRYFHSESSIRYHLEASGFLIEQVRTYEEQLYVDFQRTKLSSQVDSLIEVVAKKGT